MGERASFSRGRNPESAATGAATGGEKRLKSRLTFPLTALNPIYYL